MNTLIFLAGIAVVIMGLAIMMIQDEYGTQPTLLINATLAVNFIAGMAVIYYVVKNKGIN